MGNERLLVTWDDICRTIWLNVSGTEHAEYQQVLMLGKMLSLVSYNFCSATTFWEFSSNLPVLPCSHQSSNKRVRLLPRRAMVLPAFTGLWRRFKEDMNAVTAHWSEVAHQCCCFLSPLLSTLRQKSPTERSDIRVTESLGVEKTSEIIQASKTIVNKKGQEDWSSIFTI